MPRTRSARLTRDELEAVVDGSPHLVFVLSRDGRLRYGSPSLARALGLAPDAVASWSLDGAVHPEDAASVRKGIASALQGRAPSARRMRLRHRDGSWRAFEARAHRVDRDGRASGVVVRLRESGEGHDGRGSRDALTGLPDRGVFVERLQRSLVRASRQKDYGVAVMALDPDRLKLVNTGLGRRSGDQLLRVPRPEAGRLATPGDLVARVGGDSFMLLVDHIPGPRRGDPAWPNACARR